jgi:hypothetical protein
MPTPHQREVWNANLEPVVGHAAAERAQRERTDAA